MSGGLIVMANLSTIVLMPRFGPMPLVAFRDDGRVGRLGASVGTSLLNTIFASAVASYVTANLSVAWIIGRQALSGAGAGTRLRHRILVDRRYLAGGAVIAGALLGPGPLDQQARPSQAHDGVPTAQAKAGPARRA